MGIRVSNEGGLGSSISVWKVGMLGKRRRKQWGGEELQVCELWGDHKGGGSIHQRKMSQMLNDTKTYKSLDHDPAPSMERKLNTILLQLKKTHSIPFELYNRLRSCHTHPCP